MSYGQDSHGTPMRQADFPPVPGVIPSQGRYAIAVFAAFMGIEAETLKGHLEALKIKCCIPLGRTTYVDAAAFNAGLKLQTFKRQEARGGGKRKE